MYKSIILADRPMKQFSDNSVKQKKGGEEQAGGEESLGGGERGREGLGEEKKKKTMKEGVYSVCH